MKNPIKCFGVLSLILFLIGLYYRIFWGNTAIDIQLNNGYFIISQYQLYWTFCLLFGVVSLLYFLIKKIFKLELFQFWSLAHLIGSLLSTLFIFCVLIRFGIISLGPFYSSDLMAQPTLEIIKNFSTWFSFSILLLGLTQISLLINIILSFNKNLDSKF